MLEDLFLRPAKDRPANGRLTSTTALLSAISTQTRLVVIESPSNPRLRVVDVEAIAGAARAAGAVSLIDNTFATPILQRPVALGIDVVVHSATKYLSGHSDVIAGVVAGAAQHIETVRHTIATFGGAIDPHASWLIMRGLKTLPVRMERQCRSAHRVAGWLERQAGVERVYYPFLDSHEGAALARRQMSAGGAIVSFELASGTAALRFARSLRLVTPAPSLGGVESLIGVPARTSHAAMSDVDRQRVGIRDGLLRLSVGLENIDDLLADLAQALIQCAHVESRAERAVPLRER